VPNPCTANGTPYTFTGGTISRQKSIGYYIAVGSGGNPALFQASFNSASEIQAGNSLTVSNELVEGIENMQIEYGEDTNGDSTPDYYVPAGTAGLNMADVVSIRISLLVRSPDDNLTAQPVAYTYNGATTTPADNRLRRVFSSTIAVRNRLP